MTIDARTNTSPPSSDDGEPVNIDEVVLIEEAAVILEATTLPRDPRGWRRVKAALLVEQGLADRRTAARWQDEIAAGRFDADRAADEILAASNVADVDVSVERRCGDLARDLYMVPRMRGVSGAARKAREAGRRGLAYLVVQLLVVLIFVVLFAAGLLAARYAGIDLHAPIDRVLTFVGLTPGGGGGP